MPVTDSHGYEKKYFLAFRPSQAQAGTQAGMYSNKETDIIKEDLKKEQAQAPNIRLRLKGNFRGLCRGVTPNPKFAVSL